MEQALRLRVEQGVVTSRSISVSLDMHWPTDEVRPHAWVPVLATVPALAMPPLPAWATVPAWDIVCQLYTDSAIAVLWARCELVASWACCGLGVAPNSWLAVWRAGALAAAQDVEVASTSSAVVEEDLACLCRPRPCRSRLCRPCLCRPLARRLRPPNQPTTSRLRLRAGDRPFRFHPGSARRARAYR